MSLAAQRRTFARRSIAPDSAAAAAAALHPPPQLPEFDALQRINGLRQSLCSIVASRAASSERVLTPRGNAPCGARGESEVHPTPLSARDPRGSVAGHLLAESHRRSEALLRENHRLELLCVAQEDDIKELCTEIASRRPQHHVSAAPATVAFGTAAVAGAPKRERANAKTPSISRGSKARLSLPNESNTEDASRTSSGAPAHGRIDESLRRLVGATISVFPHLSCDTAANEWEATRKVLLFLERHLLECGHLTRDYAELGTVSTVLSQTLRDVEMDQHAWHAAILDIADRLQAVQARERYCVREKDHQVRELRRKVESLTASLSRAVAARDESISRCEDLERVLCRMVEQQAVQSAEMVRVQSECKAFREEAASLRKVVQSGRSNAAAAAALAAAAPPAEVNDVPTAIGSLCDDGGGTLCETENAVQDVARLTTSVRCLEEERKALQQKLEACTRELADSERRSQRSEAVQMRAQQTKMERLQQELDVAQITPAPHLPRINDGSPSLALRRSLLPPVEHIHFDEALQPAPAVDISSMIRDLDADVVSLADEDDAVRSTGLFFHIGCCISQDAGLFNSCTASALSSLGAWRRFLLQIQAGFSDAPFYNANHAADSAQFFYALLLHSGLLPHMSRVELAGALTAALCMHCRHPGVSGCFLAAVQDPVAAGTHGCILLERCCMDTLSGILAQEQFNFCTDWADGERGALLECVGALLLPPNSSSGTLGLVRSCRAELDKGPLQLQQMPVRQQFTRLLLALSGYAFTMRAFHVNEAWSVQWFRMLQKQAELAVELGVCGFELPPDGRSVEDAHRLLVDSTVLPLCQVAAEAFPSLRSCEAAIRVNVRLWASRSQRHGAEDLLCVPLELAPPHRHAAPPLGCIGVVHDVTPVAADDERCNAKREEKLRASQYVACGSLLVDTARFLSLQQNTLAVYEENVFLRQSLEALLQELETTAKCEKNVNRAESTASSL